MLNLPTDTPAKAAVAIGFAIASACLVQELSLIREVDQANQTLAASVAEVQKRLEQYVDYLSDANKQLEYASKLHQEADELLSAGSPIQASTKRSAAQSRREDAEEEWKRAQQLRDLIDERQAESARLTAIAAQVSSSAPDRTLIYGGGLLTGLGLAGLGFTYWHSPRRKVHKPFKARRK